MFMPEHDGNPEGSPEDDPIVIGGGGGGMLLLILLMLLPLPLPPLLLPLLLLWFWLLLMLLFATAVATPDNAVDAMFAVVFVFGVVFNAVVVVAVVEVADGLDALAENAAWWAAAVLFVDICEKEDAIIGMFVVLFTRDDDEVVEGRFVMDEFEVLKN